MLLIFFKSCIMKYFLLGFVFLFCCSCPAQVNFVKVSKSGQFTINGKPYYYVGTNFWYGAILASKGVGGNRSRLIKELNNLHSIGLNNLRVLVGSDGKADCDQKVRPVLQVAPGVYNDTILDGLDYLLYQMRKRNMKVVLYLTNAWKWSGGYTQYLDWVYKGNDSSDWLDKDCSLYSRPNVWKGPAYRAYAKRFMYNDSAKALFRKHVNYILTRTNRYSKCKYKDDPTIMAWEICNEPRAFSSEGEGLFKTWISQVAAQIKSLDPNHLVTTGSEGEHGCEDDISIFEKIHDDVNIDYLCMHIWPYNWGWVTKDRLLQDVSISNAKTQDYMDRHMAIARKLKKPIVLEEFGYPRDGVKYNRFISSTRARDKYYKYVFNSFYNSRRACDVLSGCCFWAWGGLATPSHVMWKDGDDYCGDPFQEEQGLFSVFSSDEGTIYQIHRIIKKLHKIK